MPPPCHRSCTDSEENPYSGAGYVVTPDIEQAYTVSHAIDLHVHVHESCVHVAVRVLHSCAFIIVGNLCTI